MVARLKLNDLELDRANNNNNNNNIVDRRYSHTDEENEIKCGKKCACRQCPMRCPKTTSDLFILFLFFLFLFSFFDRRVRVLRVRLLFASNLAVIAVVRTAIACGTDTLLVMSMLKLNK